MISLLNLAISGPDSELELLSFSDPPEEFEMLKLPREIDLRELGLSSLPKDIGINNCGSAAAAVAGLLESLFLLQKDKIISENLLENEEFLKLPNVLQQFSMEYLMRKSRGTYSSDFDFCTALPQWILQDLKTGFIDELFIDYQYKFRQSGTDYNPQIRPVVDESVEMPPLALNLFRKDLDVTQIYHSPYFAISADPSPMQEGGFQKIKNYIARGIPVITQFLLPSQYQQEGFYQFKGAGQLHGRCQSDVLNMATDQDPKKMINLQRRLVFALIDGYGFVNGTEVWIVKLPFGLKWGARGHAYVPIGENVYCMEELALTLHPAMLGDSIPVLNISEDFQKLRDRPDLQNMYIIEEDDILTKPVEDQSTQLFTTSKDSQFQYFNNENKSVNTIDVLEFAAMFQGEKTNQFWTMGGVVFGKGKPNELYINYVNFSCKRLDYEQQQGNDLFSCIVRKQMFQQEKQMVTVLFVEIPLFAKFNADFLFYEIQPIDVQLRLFKSQQQVFYFDTSDLFGYGQVKIIRTPYIIDLKNISQNVINLNISNRRSIVLHSDDNSDYFSAEDSDMFYSIQFVGLKRESQIFDDLTILIQKSFRFQKGKILCTPTNIPGFKQNKFRGTVSCKFNGQSVRTEDGKYFAINTNATLMNVEADCQQNSYQTVANVSYICSFKLEGTTDFAYTNPLTQKTEQYSSQKFVWDLIAQYDFILKQFTSNSSDHLYIQSNSLAKDQVTICKNIGCEIDIQDIPVVCNESLCAMSEIVKFVDGDYKNYKILYPQYQIHSMQLTCFSQQPMSCDRIYGGCTGGSFVCQGQYVVNTSATTQHTQRFSFSSSTYKCSQNFQKIDIDKQSSIISIQCFITASGTANSEILVRGVNALDSNPQIDGISVPPLVAIKRYSALESNLASLISLSLFLVITSGITLYTFYRYAEKIKAKVGKTARIVKESGPYVLSNQVLENEYLQKLRQLKRSTEPRNTRINHSRGSGFLGVESDTLSQINNTTQKLSGSSEKQSYENKETPPEVQEQRLKLKKPMVQTFSKPPPKPVIRVPAKAEVPTQKQLITTRNVGVAKGGFNPEYRNSRKVQ